jgi:hypothetical protein
MPPSSVHAQRGIKLISFYAKANSAENNVRLYWSFGNDTSLASIVIENSQDHVNFTPVATVPHVNTVPLIASYQYIHQNPTLGNNIYRLRFIFRNGVEYLSWNTRVYVRPQVINPTFSSSGKMHGDPDDPWIKGVITDIAGRPILSFSGAEADIESLPSGIYVVRALNSTGWQASLFTK